MALPVIAQDRLLRHSTPRAFTGLGSSVAAMSRDAMGCGSEQIKNICWISDSSIHEYNETKKTYKFNTEWPHLLYQVDHNPLKTLEVARTLEKSAHPCSKATRGLITKNLVHIMRAVPEQLSSLLTSIPGQREGFKPRKI
ncbi:hypothetical protein TNCV_60351 [Trichonephila clavipes]|nr:hypothetical protein TNCV_60351 [Trichonephila clavipes]